MSGAPVGPNTARVRIKGHTGSVVRFFLIAVRLCLLCRRRPQRATSNRRRSRWEVALFFRQLKLKLTCPPPQKNPLPQMAFMIMWVMVTAQLGHYSKLYGPQVLLLLNFAFYVPSIPMLVLSANLEPYLERTMGHVPSMMLRINIGLGGCLALCAAFPFVPEHPNRAWVLYTLVAALGVLSSLAFSTTYQVRRRQQCAAARMLPYRADGMRAPAPGLAFGRGAAWTGAMHAFRFAGTMHACLSHATKVNLLPCS